ncbi:unnamed protein product [Cylindrotheca closterium]|uniref:Uncharacterized protein n=1 Tax=Cylindrotheca closterium TaxID=2856 RepID=A0AAD2JME4_9STRA|nr:unnamed protein product [Cylindrotheca closterium]
MTPTRTIPINRDPQILRREAQEAQMVRMAEVQDHMFYNRLVNGMRERQAQSASLPTNSKMEGERQASFMEKLPSTPSLSGVPVSVLMSPDRSRRSFHYESHRHQSTASTVSTSPSNSVLSSSPRYAMPMQGHLERADLCNVLTQSIQILDEENGCGGGAEEDELMFEMDF